MQGKLIENLKHHIIQIKLELIKGRKNFTAKKKYRKTSSISRTKSPNLNASHLVLQLPLLNPLKPNAKLRMKM